MGNNMIINRKLFDAAGDGELAQCEALILKKADVNWSGSASFLSSQFRQILSPPCSFNNSREHVMNFSK